MVFSVARRDVHTWHEEDGEDGVVLRAGGVQAQVGDEAKGLCVGDVDAVQEGEQVQQADEGQDVPVDAGHELPLRGVRRADDAELVVPLPGGGGGVVVVLQAAVPVVGVVSRAILHAGPVAVEILGAGVVLFGWTEGRKVWFVSGVVH